VAEDVEKVNPDLVARDEQGKPYSVRYEAVNAMLLNEFLKEHRKVEKLEATVAQQDKDFEAAVADQTGTGWNGSWFLFEEEGLLGGTRTRESTSQRNWAGKIVRAEVNFANVCKFTFRNGRQDSVALAILAVRGDRALSQLCHPILHHADNRADRTHLFEPWES